MPPDRSVINPQLARPERGIVPDNGLLRRFRADVRKTSALTAVSAAQVHGLISVGQS